MSSCSTFVKQDAILLYICYVFLKIYLVKEKEIGYVFNFFSQISVAAVEITNGKVSVGDTLHFKGHTTDFKLRVASIQIEHESVKEAKKADSIGIKVSGKARKMDKVYKLIED